MPSVPPYGGQIAPEQYSYGPAQTVGPVPPPPPPVPPGYQSQLQQQAHPPAPVASDQSGTVNYTTSSPLERPLPQPPLAVATDFGPSPNTGNGPPPVPPKTSSNVLTTSSSMGLFSPSDWEHLGPTPEYIDDTEVFASKKTTPVPPAEPCQSHATFMHRPASNPYIPTSTPPQSVSPALQVSHVDDQVGMQKPSTESPISTSSTQELPRPSGPSRVNTAETMQSSATGTTEKIDGLIEAWTRPISPDARKSANSSRQNSLPRPADRTIQRKPSPIGIPTSRSGSTTPAKDRQQLSTPDSSTANAGGATRLTVVDPYEDLDPWFKSSLTRYVAMLRKEAVADSDEERHKIFTAFTAKEMKLREILYGVEHEPKSPKGEDVNPRQPTPSPQQSAEKDKEKEDQPTPQSSAPVESGLIPVESEQDVPESTYTAEDFENGEYSPGGRPIIPRLYTPNNLERPATQPPGHPASKLTDTGSQHGGQDQFSRSSSVPPSMNSEIHTQTFAPLTTNPPQPIYTPFRYIEGPQRGSDDLALDKPAYQAYSDLRQASAESGRVMANAPDSDTKTGVNTRVSSPANNEHSETFIGLIREKSVTYKKRRPRRASSPPPLPPSLRQGRPDPVSDLRSMVSSPLAKQSESSWHITTKKSLEQYSDDFAYIQEAFSTWETTAKTRRQNLDKERMQRQEESEAHVDSLFNGKEIGYADINVLEEEFRQAEARVQLGEERQELDDFIKNVFNPLDERLGREITALLNHYESALSQLSHENSKIKDSGDRHNLSHTMNIVNNIYRNLEMRYQKRLNTAFDRERRRKKAERRPLVFMGDSAALRKLDNEFDQMEKRNIFEAAKDRDERANQLMDAFDDAIMHGLGENQSLLDDVSAKVKKVDASHLQSTSLSGSEVEQILKSVSTMVDSLRRDSESILHNFGIADSTLNNADYRLSVAEARYTNADHDVFRRLNAEKQKEDAKIQKDLESKLESVQDGPAEVTHKINELLEALGKDPVAEPETSSDVQTSSSHPVDSLMPGPRPATAGPLSNEDSEHQQRIRRALEAAKKRNAAKAHGTMALQ